MKRIPKWARYLIAVLGLFLMTASSCDEKGLGDAPVGDAKEAPRDVIVMPDRFPNMVVVCDGPTRLYVNTRDGGFMAVVDEHPACAGEDPITEQGEDADYTSEDQ